MANLSEYRQKLVRLTAQLTFDVLRQNFKCLSILFNLLRRSPHVEYPNLFVALRGFERKTFIIVRLVFHLIKLLFCVFYCDWISFLIKLLVWK